jgi:hypothetical protein
VNKRLFGALALLALAAVLGCSKSPNGAGMGRVNLHLTDAPGDFQQVNVVITAVSINRDGSGWETVQDESQTFDLLTLQNGVTTTLGSSDVPAGHYDQVRLLVGEGSNVMVDDVTHALEVPSGQQSGIKVIGGFDVPEGGVLDLTIDFDAAKSVVLTGNGKYLLKPVIKVVSAEETD